MINGKVTQTQIIKNKKENLAVKGSCPAGDFTIAPPPSYNMYRGYIKLWRKGKDWSLSNRPKALSLWVHLLWEANHKPTRKIFKGNIIDIHPGQLLTGRKYLSSLCGVAESTIEKYLKLFEKEQQIIQQKSTKNRLITILNWNMYQGKDEKVDNKKTTERQQKDTPKNDKNVKNEKNIRPTSLQSVILFYFIIKDYIKDGESIEDKTWIKQNFTRPAKAAKRLLALGTADEIKAMITKGKAYFEEKKLSWTLETIEKSWNEIKAYTGKKRYS